MFEFFEEEMIGNSIQFFVEFEQKNIFYIFSPLGST
jgi:hypothetical protein